MDSETGRATTASGSIAGLIISCAVLFALLVPWGILIAWLVSGKVESATLGAAAVAIGVCWLAGALALAATYLGQRLASPVHGVLSGMLFRMGLPMAVGFVLHRQGGPLAQAGVFTMILGVYLFALVVETLLSLWCMPSARSPVSEVRGSVAKATASPSA